MGGENDIWKITELREEIRGLETRIQGNVEQLGNLTSQFQNLVKSAGEMGQEIMELKAQRVDHKKRLDELEKELQIETNIAAAKSQVDHHEERLDALESLGIPAALDKLIFAANDADARIRKVGKLVEDLEELAIPTNIADTLENHKKGIDRLADRIQDLLGIADQVQALAERNASPFNPFDWNKLVERVRKLEAGQIQYSPDGSAFFMHVPTAIKEIGTRTEDLKADTAKIRQRLSKVEGEVDGILAGRKAELKCYEENLAIEPKRRQLPNGDVEVDYGWTKVTFHTGPSEEELKRGETPAAIGDTWGGVLRLQHRLEKGFEEMDRRVQEVEIRVGVRDGKATAREELEKILDRPQDLPPPPLPKALWPAVTITPENEPLENSEKDTEAAIAKVRQGMVEPKPSFEHTGREKPKLIMNPRQYFKDLALHACRAEEITEGHCRDILAFIDGLDNRGTDRMAELFLLGWPEQQKGPCK